MALPRISDMYWSGTPGIYGSARAGLVTTPSTDTTYQAWLSIYGQTQLWPQDATGAQTAAALDSVLEAAGLPPITTTVTTKAQLQAAMSAQVGSLLNASRNYTVAGVAPAISCDCGPSLNDVQEAFDWGNIPNQNGTLEWIDNAYANFSLTAAEALAFANEVGAYKQSVYAEASTVNQGINSGSITTLAQIASAAWPT